MDMSENDATPTPDEEVPAHEEVFEDEGAEPEATLPPLYSRLIDAFFSPGRMASTVAENPKWVAALLVAAVLIGIQMALIPADIFVAAQREAVMNAGGDVGEMPETALKVIRIVTPIFTIISTLIFAFVFAGIYTVIFAFVLGDEGRYKQYLAVLSHAWVIPASLGLLLVPLRISTENPQATLNLGSFLFFMPSGYWLNVFTSMDLTQIWAALVIAQGCHAIDDRRSFGSAATILIVILFGIALIAGRFLPT